MLEFYEPVLNLSDPEHHNTMGRFSRSGTLWTETFSGMPLKR